MSARAKKLNISRLYMNKRGCLNNSFSGFIIHLWHRDSELQTLLATDTDFTARWREVSGSTRVYVKCNTTIQQHPKGMVSETCQEMVENTE
jgi:hypothetical protein